MLNDPDLCYQAILSKDSRWDGVFFVGVTSTGVYCRPSCPAQPPKRANVRFHPSAAAAQAAGFRACKRCRPDATPGSPEWNVRADLVGRAMRLIGDGVVDRDGVAGLARRLGFSERHLHRQLVAEVGAGPIAIARAQRAQTARVLLETTDLPVGDVAFAAGFASIRQFNETVREVFAVTPTELRRGRRHEPDAGPATGAGAGAGAVGTITVRLPYRAPIALPELFEFLGTRAVAGVEEWDGAVYRRGTALPRGPGVIELSAGAGPYVHCTLRLTDVRDLAVAVQRCRRLLDLDADPVAVDAALGADPLLGPLVAKTAGLRVPGSLDGAEMAVRAVLGQQITVAAARTLAGRLVERWGTPLAEPVGAVTHLFPTAAALAGADLAGAQPEGIRMPASRLRTLTTVSTALHTGELVLDPGVDRADTERQLLALPGIGPWTAGYLAMRAVGDPDVFLPTDAGVRIALDRLEVDQDPKAVAALAERWRPWRSYALLHLWGTLSRKEGI